METVPYSVYDIRLYTKKSTLPKITRSYRGDRRSAFPGSATGHDISLRCTAKSQLRTDKGLRERTEQLDILLFSAHHQCWVRSS